MSTGRVSDPSEMRWISSPKRARRWSAGIVRLTVEPANDAAILLYRSLGFRPEPPDGGMRRDYFGPGEDREVMCLVL